jgi:hypothetical protein
MQRGGSKSEALYISELSVECVYSYIVDATGSGTSSWINLCQFMPIYANLCQFMPAFACFLGHCDADERVHLGLYDIYVPWSFMAWHVFASSV